MRAGDEIMPNCNELGLPACTGWLKPLPRYWPRPGTAGTLLQQLIVSNNPLLEKRLIRLILPGKG